jgi:predicted nucleic acid-binding protein
MSRVIFLLDTNVVIGLLAGSEPATRLIQRNKAKFNKLAISRISRIELLSFHALTVAGEVELDEFISSVRVYPINVQIESAAIALRRRTRLKLPDAIIGATAQVHGLTLLTLDKRLQAALLVQLPCVVGNTLISRGKGGPGSAARLSRGHATHQRLDIPD